MSSFKRKTSSIQSSLPAGTRSCPSSTLTVLTSTGIPSLDDILGGGMPLSCSLLVLAPDPHTLYGELVQKYFIAQGLACGQNICIIDDDAKNMAQECMWKTGDHTPEHENESDTPHDEIKIAWRYAQIGKFQTTVSALSDEEYCEKLELTCRIPGHVVDAALDSGQLICLGVNSECISKILHQIEQKLRVGHEGPETPRPMRVCIPSLGSPQWGDLTGQHILQFLHSLRRLLRIYKHGCACICLPSHLSWNGWDGESWIPRLGWIADGAITLSAFSADPSLSRSFPGHHGFLHIHSLPGPHTILAPSDKLSRLRGVTSYGGSGENNIGFKCTRKRLIFETLHLDVIERRIDVDEGSVEVEEGKGKKKVSFQTELIW